MKKSISLLLAFIASFLLFSCKGSANPDTSTEITPAYYVSITNNSDFQIDLCSFKFTSDDNLKNIAPDTTREIKISEDIDVIEFQVVYHIQVEGIDIPYHDNDCDVRVALRKNKPVKAVVQNPDINLTKSWLIIENQSSYGICLFNGLDEVTPKNLSGSILNIEEFGFII